METAFVLARERRAGAHAETHYLTSPETLSAVTLHRDNAARLTEEDAARLLGRVHPSGRMSSDIAGPP